MSNKSMGTDYEVALARALSDKGFWVHLLQANRAGQPADIIAAKNGKAFLIDSKVCSTDKGFALSRIEDNQRYAMKLWENCGNGTAFFALWLNEDDVFFFPASTLVMLRKYHKTALPPKDIISYGFTLEEWVRMYAY